MKFFIDSADVDEIREAMAMGTCDGVTTNPTLVARTGRRFGDVVREILELKPGPVSVEVGATETQAMLREAREFVQLGESVVVKLPLTLDGLKATRVLNAEEVNVNVTLCFSATQALLAAKAGATYISPFVGRLDDISSDGMRLVRDIRKVYDNYGIEVLILAASLRSPMHVLESALAAVDVVTMPLSVMRQLVRHPLTDAGLQQFLADWKKAPGLE